ncbi:hypothetical protein HOY80DRAFT_952466 [Tuber brumale]|nr:hypothetical protein HOY80DRAFT_952466 [Tuber brumale]
MLGIRSRLLVFTGPPSLLLILAVYTLPHRVLLIFHFPPSSTTPDDKLVGTACMVSDGVLAATIYRACRLLPTLTL